MRTVPPATGLPRVVYVLMLGLLYPVVSRVLPLVCPTITCVEMFIPQIMYRLKTLCKVRTPSDFENA